MSYDTAAVAAAIAAALVAGVGNPLVAVYPSPPATFNPPALIVQLPQTVTLHTPAFATDLGSLTVLAAVGLPEAAALSDLLAAATAAIEADPTLAGAVQAAKAVEWRNWRILAVAGSEFLSAELALTVQT